MSFWDIMLAGLAGGSLPLIGVVLSLRHERARHVSARMLEDRHNCIRRMLEAEKHFYFAMSSLLASFPVRPGGVTAAEVYDRFFREYHSLVDALTSGLVYASHRKNSEPPLFDYDAFGDWAHAWMIGIISGVDDQDKDAPLQVERIGNGIAELSKITGHFDRVRSWAMGELSPEGLAILSREAMRPSLWNRCWRYMSEQLKSSKRPASNVPTATAPKAGTEGQATT